LFKFRHNLLPCIDRSLMDIIVYINERQWRTTAQVAVLSQRGRAMLPVCLVSFNSTIPRAQSFSISYCGIRMIRLSLLVINTSSTVPANNKRCRLATCHGPAQLTAVCITIGARTAEDMWWSQISVENRILPNPPWYVFDSPIRGGGCRKIAVTFGAEKLQWCGHPVVKKFWRYVYSFQQNTRRWQTDGRTDRRKEGRTVGWMDGRQTPRDGIGRVYA